MAGLRIEIRGTVQGVGFRPWVYRLAQQKGLRGSVRNDARGVTIEAFGEPAVLESFIEELREDAPSPARVFELRSASIPELDCDRFLIQASAAGGDKALSIPPDLATCSRCESEVLDPEDRRYRYAFTNCTSCGPRFTIATGIPYDRAATTMARFEICADCKREYDAVDDRRFHAQPNACPSCGPSLELIFLGGREARHGDPLRNAAEMLKQGAVIGVKGLGGFHLACDAGSSEAVRALRERKHRDEKPFAVMVRDLGTARGLAHLSTEEEELLSSPERPIVLVQRRAGMELAEEISPDTPLLGLILPYTPLHHLLLEEVGAPLVMTSGNISDEPICKGNEEARDRLEGIADALLVHDREIAMRCDDSVTRLIAGAPTVMRRSRGFVPRPIMLQHSVSVPVLACGAHLKNAFCLVADDTAYFGPHIGDLESLAALEFFEEAVERMENILSIRPELIAHDLHPGYLSTRYALSRNGVRRVGVQHHHAHVVSAMAEHHRDGPVLGVAFDGTGWGEDGTSWGGEFLLCFRGKYERLASFRPIALPGGDLAMREVWRIAYAFLHDAFEGEPPLDELSLFDQVPVESIRVVKQMLECELNSPLARGVGRYFDAFGALAMQRAHSSHEGQVAIAWDFIAEENHDELYPYELDRSREPMEIDLRPAMRAAVADLSSSVRPGRVSARFHNTVTGVTVAILRQLLAELEPMPVVLTGGVFQNSRLCSGIERQLANEYDILRHRDVPPGDGGIALGQALIAEAFLGENS